MRPLMRPLIRFVLAATTVVGAQVTLAQETAAPATQPLAVPPAPSTAAPAQTPGRGLTMAQVKDKFGSPTQEAPAVGTPPISRWEYPGYVVFFESDRVLHTVVTPR
jgi:hypothetical protein